MAFKSLFSERSIRFLNGCKENAQQVHFDAVNGPIFLTTLIGEEMAHLGEYVINEGGYSAEELGNTLGEYISKRREELIVPEAPIKSLADRILGRIAEPKLQSEKEAIATLEGEDGENYTYDLTVEVLKIIATAIQSCEEKNLAKIEPLHLVAAMFATESETLKKFFTDLGLKFTQAKELFCSSKIFNIDKVPYELLDFLVYMNEEVDVTKPCDVLMRDKEIEQIWNISLKMYKHNTLLVGKPGVGKTALMQKLTYEIKTGNCPEEFKDCLVLKLQLNAIMSDEGNAIEEVVKFLKGKSNIVLLIDDVNSIISLGTMPKATMDFLDILKMLVDSGVIIICAISEKEYAALHSCDGSLFRVFERVILEEPIGAEVYPMIKKKVEALEEYHGVTIVQGYAEYAVMVGNCFEAYKTNPDKTLDLIDRAMVIAKRKGKIMVEHSDIQESFEIDFELYEGMDEYARKETAYHEAGHYIVGKASKSLAEFLNWQAVSSVPAEGNRGITAPELRKDKTPHANKQFYLDYLAYCLGGRVAEKVYTNDVTSGAEQDLYSATSLAREIVTQYGISANDDERNNVFLKLMLTEKSTNEINEEILAFVDKAYKQAEKVIEEHKELLEMIVEELLERRIMSEPELDEIWQAWSKRKA